MIVISGIGTACGLSILGIYMMLKSWHLNVEIVNWIPLVSFSWVTFISLMGIQSLPMSIIPEIMPLHIKEAGCGFCMSLVWISSFINMKYSQFFIETIGFHWTMYIFAGICLSCTVIVLICLPETKAKSHQEIMKLLE